MPLLSPERTNLPYFWRVLPAPNSVSFLSVSPSLCPYHLSSLWYMIALALFVNTLEHKLHFDFYTFSHAFKVLDITYSLSLTTMQVLSQRLTLARMLTPLAASPTEGVEVQVSRRISQCRVSLTPTQRIFLQTAAR